MLNYIGQPLPAGERSHSKSGAELKQATGSETRRGQLARLAGFYWHTALLFA